MENLKNTSKKSSKEKILKKLPENPTCLVTWETKSGKIYYVIFDSGKQIHNVYIPVENGYKILLSTKDYYSIEKELNNYEN